MILVDTSVWIDHLRRPNAELIEHLESRNVLTHPMVIGELACGNLRNRTEFLRHLQALPGVEPLTAAALLSLMDSRRLMGRGMGYVDVNLVGSVLAHGDASLWTADKRLEQVARELGVAYLDGAKAR